MKTFIQCILLLLALVNITLAQKCVMKIKLVMDNASKSPISKQEFTLKFYHPTTKRLEKTIPCGPTDPLGETIATFDMNPYYKCILSLPEKSGFNDSEFTYSTCASEKTFILSQKPLPTPPDPQLLAKVRLYKTRLDSTETTLKKLIYRDGQKQQKIDSLIKVLDEERKRVNEIIKNLEGDKQIADDKLKQAIIMLGNSNEENKVLKTILVQLNKMRIRLLDFTCHKFDDRNSFTFSTRLTDFDYTIDTKTEPTLQTFRVYLYAITGKKGPDGSRRRPIRHSNNSFEMTFTAQYPMKSSDKSTLLTFQAHPDSKDLLVSNNNFEVEIFEHTTKSFLGKHEIPSKDLCVTPPIPEQPNIIGVLTTDCERVTFEITDAGAEDGDRINLKWIGNPNVLENFTLTKKSYYQEVTLSKGINNFELEGVNPGSNPKEVSAKIQCHCGSQRGPLLYFNMGGQQRNFISLFNSMDDVNGKIVNTSKKGFVINYYPR